MDTPDSAGEALELFIAHPRPDRYRPRGGATEGAIAAREARLKQVLPDELRDLLLEHDGIRETEVNSGDLLGGTGTLSALRSRFRKQWVDLAEELEEDVPFRFGRRYLVLGTTGGTGHDFALLDLARTIDDGHPVLRFDFDDGEEVTGFRSLAHYLHWVLLSSNDLPLAKLAKLFPERYSASRFKRLMKTATRVELPAR